MLFGLEASFRAWSCGRQLGVRGVLSAGWGEVQPSLCSLGLELGLAIGVGPAGSGSLASPPLSLRGLRAVFLARWCFSSRCSIGPGCSARSLLLPVCSGFRCCLLGSCCVCSYPATLQSPLLLPSRSLTALRDQLGNLVVKLLVLTGGFIAQSFFVVVNPRPRIFFFH